MLESHHRELHKIEATYWWFQVRFRIVERLLLAHDLLTPQARLVDWGCGTGGFLEYLIGRGRVSPSQVCGVEPGEHAQQVLRSKGIPSVALAPVAQLKGTMADLPTAITMLDVLEHVEDRTAALRDLHTLAAPGATLILTVPAFMFLWSEWDTVLGHKTRYTISGLRADLLAAEWQPVSARLIFNSMFFPAFLRSALLKQSIGRSEFPRVPPLLNRLLIAWHGVESRVPGIPFGTSIVCLARRSTSANRQ